jgi:hypothetical protein
MDAIDPTAREEFNRLLEQVPESGLAWERRLDQLQAWRREPRFETYWQLIDQMLTVDFPSFRRKVAATEAGGRLDGYDFDAWRRQRDYDLKHAHDHLP